MHISHYGRFSRLLVVWTAIFIGGCIGTDFLEETADLVDPYIALAPEVGAIELGEDITFEAMYFDSTGTQVSTAFDWSSSDDNIVRISSEGQATGIEAGQVRIFASTNGLTSEALLTVLADPSAVAFVTLDPKSAAVTEGETISFSVEVTNGNGEVLSDRTVEWRTTNTDVATVDAAGNVQAIMPGDVQIIATADGIESAPADLTVLATSKTGTFRRTPGSSYTVAGTAIFEQLESGELQVRFLDNFTVSNGPDLYVYLSTESKVNASSVSLGRLVSTSGAQTYAVTGNVSIGDFDNVIIHCLPFNVSFGFAPLN